MIRLDFQNFKIPTGICKTHFRNGDVRESVANMIYMNVNGIRAHSLALKIYQSEGAIDYTDEEIRTIIEVSNLYGTPAFIDGLRFQMGINE